VVDVKDIGTVAEHEQNRLSLNCFFLYNLSAACVVFFQFGMIVLIVGIDRPHSRTAVFSRKLQAGTGSDCQLQHHSAINLDGLRDLTKHTIKNC
jgi:hypothetical protein